MHFPYVNLLIKRKSSVAGIEHVGGSMLVSIPKADAIMMKVKVQLFNGT